MMKKKQLEILLSQLAPSPKPKLKWEGYALDPESAAQMACTAAYVHNDIYGKKIVDLGCGSGVLAIAASLLGADWVVGVDIDREAVQVGRANAKRIGVSIDLVAGDIGCVAGRFDVTLMNPPFGSWKKGADVRFLKKALSISDVVYSLHKGSEIVRRYLGQRIPQIGGRINEVREMEIVIARTYRFHRKRRYPVKVDLYRILNART